VSPAATLKVRVIPNARKTEFTGYRDDELILRLNAPAVEGKANKAALEFVSDYFGVARSAVVLLRGERSRHKIFQIVGLENGDLERKLASLNH
jgi:uncharacterized protein (TIGR00251 family)